LLLGLQAKNISSRRDGATIVFKYIFKYLRSFYLKHRCYKAVEDRTGPGPSSFLRSSSPHLLLAVIRRRRNSGGTGPSSPLVPQFCISLFADIRVGPAASSSDGRSGRRGQGVRRRIRRRRRSGRSRPPVRHGQGISLSLLFDIGFLCSVLPQFLSAFLVGPVSGFQPC
jgi:hypothetical protein